MSGSRCARGIVAILVGLAPALLQCAAPRVGLDELSSQPIALLYWNADEARQRREMAERVQGTNGAGPRHRGVATLDGITALLEGGRDREAVTGRAGRRIPGHLVLLDPRTRAIMPFPAAPPDARPLAWSRDHRRLLFASRHRDGRTTQLYEFDRERRELRSLTHGLAQHLEGDYGPAGQLAVGWVRLGGERPHPGLDLMDAGGAIGSHLLDGLYPRGIRWSPDGGLLLYTLTDERSGRSRTGRDRSFIVTQPPVAGAERQWLAPGRDAVFSPDGEWIVFAAVMRGEWVLQRMRKDGSARATIGLALDAAEAHHPSVSPDGHHLVYVAEGDGFERLQVRRFDGSGDRILFDEGAVAYPVW